MKKINIFLTVALLTLVVAGVAEAAISIPASSGGAWDDKIKAMVNAVLDIAVWVCAASGAGAIILWGIKLAGGRNEKVFLVGGIIAMIAAFAAYDLPSYINDLS